jgi:hypothetical protein
VPLFLALTKPTQIWLYAAARNAGCRSESPRLRTYESDGRSAQMLALERINEFVDIEKEIVVIARDLVKTITGRGIYSRTSGRNGRQVLAGENVAGFFAFHFIQNANRLDRVRRHSRLRNPRPASGHTCTHVERHPRILLKRESTRDPASRTVWGRVGPTELRLTRLGV